MISGLYMVAERLQDRAFFGVGLIQLDQRLQDLRKERVALQAAFVDIAVHLDLIAPAPELHQLVHLVDQRYGTPARAFKSQIAARAPVPGLELDLGAAPAALFPFLLAALLSALDPSLWTVVLAISVTRLPFGGRVIRSVALQIREMEYVTSARAIGAKDFRIMFRHVAPQCVAPYLILATAHLGVAILIESGLGFLGAGVPPPTATWGNMLAFANFSSFKPLWWMAFYPGLAITVTVLAFNLFGDSLRDVLDPRLRNR